MLRFFPIGIILRRPILFAGLFCLFFFSALVYFFWPIDQSAETSILIPIKIKNLPHGLIITGPALTDLEALVKGPQTILDTLTDEKLFYLLDLSGVKIGLETILLDSKNLRLPPMISLVKLHTASITLRFAREITKPLPVIIALNGSPGAGFVVQEALAQPANVILSGPEEVLSHINKVNTKPIDVSGATESFKKEIVLDLLESVSIISPDKVVIAKILISEKITTRTISNIPVTGQGSPYRFEIMPQTISIKISGPLNILKKLQLQDRIKVHVDLRDLKPGVFVRRAIIDLPLKATLVSVEPKLFTIKIIRNEDKITSSTMHHSFRPSLPDLKLQKS